VSATESLLIEGSSLPLQSGGEDRKEGHFRPQVFLYREGREWHAGWLRPADELAYCSVTLQFRWWQGSVEGSRKLCLSLQKVTVAGYDSSDDSPSRLSYDSIDALITFLGKHWPGLSTDMDEFRVWLVLQLRTGTDQETKCQKRGLGSRVPRKGGLAEEQKALLVETAEMLKGHRRRLFMARAVKALGRGGQRFAAAELGWSRGTVRKGMRELEGGFRYPDGYSARGRKRAEEHLPNLLADIQDVKTCLSNYVSAAEVRRRLISQKGYRDRELPSAETIRVKLHQLGYCLSRKRGPAAKRTSNQEAFF